MSHPNVYSRRRLLAIARRKRLKKPTARSIVRKKYPEAFGWREFTVSDYVVKTEPGGEVIGRGYSAKAAWEMAANNSVDSTAKAKP